MSTFATEIPDGLLFGVAPVLLTLSATLLTWLVLQAGKNGSRLDVKDSQDQMRDSLIRDHEERLREGGL